MLFKPIKRQIIDLNTVRYRDLHLLRQQYTAVPGVRKLDERFDIAPILSEEPVFRTHPATETDFLNCAANEPRRAAMAPLVARKWKYITSAEEEILGGGSVFIEGVAGAGKTTLAQGIIERQRSLGKKCIICLQ